MPRELSFCEAPYRRNAESDESMHCLYKPEAWEKLAGGEAERNHRNAAGMISALKGARENIELSCAPFGANDASLVDRWLRSFLTSPPANFLQASGLAKRAMLSTKAKAIRAHLWFRFRLAAVRVEFRQRLRIAAPWVKWQTHG